MKLVTKTIIEGSDDNVPMPTTCSLKGDSDYFHSYSHFGIHHEMLNVSLLLMFFKYFSPVESNFIIKICLCWHNRIDSIQMNIYLKS